MFPAIIHFCILGSFGELQNLRSLGGPELSILIKMPLLLSSVQNLDGTSAPSILLCLIGLHCFLVEYYERHLIYL